MVVKLKLVLFSVHSKLIKKGLFYSAHIVFQYLQGNRSQSVKEAVQFWLIYFDLYEYWSKCNG